MTEKVNTFVALFEKWNKSINLSAASTRAELREHLEDCLHVVPLLRARLPVLPSHSPQVLDVGSGGGFPVVVAAIELPEITFTSLEPVHKKHAFLRTVARELALPNLVPLARRLDDHDGRDYDAAMSRATFDLADWLAMGIARVRAGGIVLGFEAVPRSDLPPTIERHAYSLANKQRSIVLLPVGSSAP
jgi:16S rRNA (guanine527-N7)-methyltransferase